MTLCYTEPSYHCYRSLHGKIIYKGETQLVYKHAQLKGKGISCKLCLKNLTLGRFFVVLTTEHKLSVVLSGSDRGPDILSEP